jgi:hypothetical protein
VLFALNQMTNWSRFYFDFYEPIIYKCPGLCVDHWFESANNPETFESVHCRACNHVHFAMWRRVECWLSTKR